MIIKLLIMFARGLASALFGSSKLLVGHQPHKKLARDYPTRPIAESLPRWKNSNFITLYHHFKDQFCLFDDAKLGRFCLH